MAIERTLSIVKPDAVAKNHIGDIFARFEKAGLQIVATKMKHLTQTEAEGFYAEHKERSIAMIGSLSQCRHENFGALYRHNAQFSAFTL